MRIFLLIKDVPELFIELLVPLVAHFHQSILHSKSVVQVLARGLPFDLRRPAIQIFAVEDRNPFRRPACVGTGTHQSH